MASARNLIQSLIFPATFRRRMLLYKQKPKDNNRNMLMLISISVVGSAVPLWFVVNEKEPVGAVIQRALESYASEGRLPVLGCNHKEFLLYCPTTAGVDALNLSDKIGDQGARSFTLYKKPPPTTQPLPPPSAAVSDHKESGSLMKAWVNKSLHLKISSH